MLVMGHDTTGQHSYQQQTADQFMPGNNIRDCPVLQTDLWIYVNLMNMNDDADEHILCMQYIKFRLQMYYNRVI